MNNKVNRWGLELTTYNITFEWISGACNKAADCLSCLVELPQDKPISVNMLSVTDTDRPAFNNRSQTCQCLSTDNSTSQPDITSDVSEARGPMPKTLTADRFSYRCRKLILSARGSPNGYPTEKHHNMKLIILHMSKAYYINM